MLYLELKTEKTKTLTLSPNVLLCYILSSPPRGPKGSSVHVLASLERLQQACKRLCSDSNTPETTGSLFTVPLQAFRAAELKSCFSVFILLAPDLAGHVRFAAEALQGQSWAGSALQVVSHQMRVIVAEIAFVG